MKKIMMIIAILGVVAFIGTTTSSAFQTVDTEIAVSVDNQDVPDGGKCAVCGKEKCDGVCKADGTKCDKKKECNKDATKCEKAKTSCCKKKSSCTKTDK